MSGLLTDDVTNRCNPDIGIDGRVEVYRSTDSGTDDEYKALGSSIDGEVGRDISAMGSGVALSRDGQVLAVGEWAWRPDLQSPFQGRVRVFRLTEAGDWVQMGSALTGENLEKRLGSAVSLNSDGHVLAVGRNDCVARVLEFDGGEWVQRGSDIGAGECPDTSRVSGEEAEVHLSADGRTLVNVGGATPVFHYDGSDWVPQSGSFATVTIDPAKAFYDLAPDGRSLLQHNRVTFRVLRYDDTSWEPLPVHIDLGEATASVKQKRDASLSADGTEILLGLGPDDIPRVGFGGFRKMRLVSRFPPVAVPVEASVQQSDTGPPPPVSITLTGSDLNGAPLTYEIASSPAHGSLDSLNPLDGKSVYTPDPGFTGVDSFTYRVNNGSTDSETAEVSVRVYADDRMVPVGSPIDGTKVKRRVPAPRWPFPVTVASWRWVRLSPMVAPQDPAARSVSTARTMGRGHPSAAPLRARRRFEEFGSLLALSQDGSTLAVGSANNGAQTLDFGPVSIFTWKATNGYSGVTHRGRHLGGAGPFVNNFP